MSGKRERDYIARHERIKDKLLELIEESETACFEVAKIASDLGMDQRTVRSHLRIMKVDSVGVFVDHDEKQFCTREGIAMLAKILKLNVKADEQQL